MTDDRELSEAGDTETGDYGRSRTNFHPWGGHLQVRCSVGLPDMHAAGSYTSAVTQGDIAATGSRGRKSARLT
jgi:hypothetical protein